ncbi:putative Shikimate dehydrogenase [Vibrio nigripulchritudo SO65]|uniref:shikimate dehydrogenase family protein n=1 Tax=Vibrio nigripulchritudo TaxID=28173 RepID=UPI0003B19BD2|nr:shikimate dehydrogenase [Vibrio nigripulchritudo]CCN36541.1 putative Shikimate dehydrogenase [Vibrio nigripulchritudo AM115]CCN43645.1 putative Shikimate dehydrogenase [Vibrio nigripulchritudo FTn2]CCN65322.1 putative Shikimate dehydrogenase [Vibrio nigripulchritudo POn4]CCN77680.1 putative Shikimate dehydrogenase [Vibrio nigripulchritudo SO65]
MNLTPASKPTFYFVGVSTKHSSIMKVFPEWAKHLQLGDVKISGIDLPLNAPANDYRTVTEFIKRDPLSVGALVTTHKLNLFQASQDLFDSIDDHAIKMNETSCLYKRGQQFGCSAKDPITSGFALDYILPERHFPNTGGEVFVMGAGGSATAICWHLAQGLSQDQRPNKIVVSDISQHRLDELAEVLSRYQIEVEVDYVLVDEGKGSEQSGNEQPSNEQPSNEQTLANMPPHSLVINATGLGKDAPGSPISDDARFPEHAIVWELNYRGDLDFLHQARSQEKQAQLEIHDGWVYFIYGWTRVIAEVFDVDIPVRGEDFDTICQIAQNA